MRNQGQRVLFSLSILTLCSVPILLTWIFTRYNMGVSCGGYFRCGSDFFATLYISGLVFCVFISKLRNLFKHVVYMNIFFILSCICIYLGNFSFVGASSRVVTKTQFLTIIMPYISYYSPLVMLFDKKSEQEGAA